MISPFMPFAKHVLHMPFYFGFLLKTISALFGTIMSKLFSNWFLSLYIRSGEVLQLLQCNSLFKGICWQKPSKIKADKLLRAVSKMEDVSKKAVIWMTTLPLFHKDSDGYACLCSKIIRRYFVNLFLLSLFTSNLPSLSALILSPLNSLVI
ncbi:hypothetical protein EDC96DRAFT_594665 [Choanephora cucurbitarum]|nr:hypothetical protein EDC96DRAFT_594665 [Choanephora cucurbitarum]